MIKYYILALLAFNLQATQAMKRSPSSLFCMPLSATVEELVAKKNFSASLQACLHVAGELKKPNQEETAQLIKDLGFALSTITAALFDSGRYLQAAQASELRMILLAQYVQNKPAKRSASWTLDPTLLENSDFTQSLHRHISYVESCRASVVTNGTIQKRPSSGIKKSTDLESTYLTLEGMALQLQEFVAPEVRLALLTRSIDLRLELSETLAKCGEQEQAAQVTMSTDTFITEQTSLLQNDPELHDKFWAHALNCMKEN
jgi:hypothetical protein